MLHGLVGVSSRFLLLVRQSSPGIFTDWWTSVVHVYVHRLT